MIAPTDVIERLDPTYGTNENTGDDADEKENDRWIDVELDQPFLAIRVYFALLYDDQALTVSNPLGLTPTPIGSVDVFDSVNDNGYDGVGP